LMGNVVIFGTDASKSLLSLSHSSSIKSEPHDPQVGLSPLAEFSDSCVGS
jgi:hypothetical protein